MKDRLKLKGLAIVEVWDKFGNLKDREIVSNLITNVGDQYYAERGNNDGTPTTATVTGMKLGTGSTAPSKSGAAASLVTYITGSNEDFDSSPTVVAVGTNLGYTINYEVTWEAGNVTNSAITEAVLCNDSSVDDAGTAAETVSRITFTAKDKGVDDSLKITLKHLFEGA